MAGRKKAPPSRVSSEEGAGGWLEERRPLCLVFRVREGLVGELEGRRPLCLAFRAREGLVDVVEGTPPRRVMAVESEVELQQVVKFNIHVMCHVIFGTK